MDAQAALTEGRDFAWGMNLISRKGGSLSSQRLVGVRRTHTLSVSM